MGVGASAQEEAISARVLSLQRDTSNWPHLLSEFVSLVPPGAPLRCKHPRILQVVLTLCADQLTSSPHPSTSLLIDAATRLLGAKSLYAHIPRIPLRPLFDLAATADASLLPSLLGLLLAIIHPTGIASSGDEKLERANKLHFDRSGGVELVLATLDRFSWPNEPHDAEAHTRIVTLSLQLLQSLLVIRSVTTEYATLVKLVAAFVHKARGRSLQRLAIPFHLECHCRRLRFFISAATPTATCAFARRACCRRSFWSVTASSIAPSSSAAALRAPCCGCLCSPSRVACSSCLAPPHLTLTS